MMLIEDVRGVSEEGKDDQGEVTGKADEWQQRNSIQRVSALPACVMRRLYELTSQ